MSVQIEGLEKRCPSTTKVLPTPLQILSPSLADEVLPKALHLFLFDQLKPALRYSFRASESTRVIQRIICV